MLAIPRLVEFELVVQIRFFQISQKQDAPTERRHAVFTDCVPRELVDGVVVAVDRKADLPKIKVPTLTVGAHFDTMDPEQMKWMSTQVQQGRYLYCPDGSHMCMWDDQKHFFPGIISFIKDVDDGNLA